MANRTTITTVISPELRKMGYERKASKFLRMTEEGHSSLIHFRKTGPSKYGYLVDIEFRPIGWMNYAGDKLDLGPWDFTGGMLRGRIRFPRQDGAFSEYLWFGDDEDGVSNAEYFVELYRRACDPLLRRMEDPEVVLRFADGEVWSEQYRWMCLQMPEKTLSSLIVQAGYGPSLKLYAAIDALPEDSSIWPIQWLKEVASRWRTANTG